MFDVMTNLPQKPGVVHDPFYGKIKIINKRFKNNSSDTNKINNNSIKINEKENNKINEININDKKSLINQISQINIISNINGGNKNIKKNNK